MCGELVGFIEYDEVPAGGTELVLQVFVTRHLVKTHDEVIDVLKRIATWRSGFQVFAEDTELQAELLKHFIAPLLDWDQRTRSQQDITSGISRDLKKIAGIQVVPQSPSAFGQRGAGRPVQRWYSARAAAHR